MLKLLALPFLVASIGLGAASTANACGGSSSCPMMATAPVAVAQQPGAGEVRRSYSYQPSMGTYRSYQAPMMRSYRGSTPSDAGAKFRGDFGR